MTGPIQLNTIIVSDLESIINEKKLECSCYFFDWKSFRPFQPIFAWTAEPSGQLIGGCTLYFRMWPYWTESYWCIFIKIYI